MSKAKSRAKSARPKTSASQSRPRTDGTPAADVHARAGFPEFERFLDALRATRELPGYYPETLTATDRKNALREANTGNLRNAAILTREACTEWGDVYGVLGTITDTLFGLPQKWQGPEAIVDALRGDDERPGLADALIPETEAAAIMRAGIPFGVGLGRLSKFTIGGRDMRRLNAWDSEHLRYNWASDTWQISTNLGVEWHDVTEGEWVLFLPYGDKYPWKRSPWKAITLAYVLSRDGWFQRSRYSQAITPTRVGTTSQDSNEAHRQEFAALLAAAKFDTWLMLRPGETYDVKGVSGGDRSVEVFASIIDWARRTVITALKGETVTTDGGKGFASDATQERISTAKMSFYARAWSRFESQIFSWAAYDLTGQHARVSRLYQTATPEDALSRIKVLEAVGSALDKNEAGLKTVGLRLTKKTAADIMRSIGAEVEDLPAATAAAKIDFAPTDIARMVTKDEGRASLGLPALPEGRGKDFIADENAADPGAAPLPAPVPVPQEVAP